MKTYGNIYGNIYSYKNLELAFKKARLGKSAKSYVKEFEDNLENELNKLKDELETLRYKPRPHIKFIVRDPKTRKIHASAFRDRVIYHALCNIIEPIFDKTFICDSYASRKNKGALKAVARFDQFKRKITQNGQLVYNAYDNNTKGYYLKADVKHYFETVDHEILLNIIKRKIKDEKVIWLIKQILENFNIEIQGRGMPLGNLTSQFFANIYLNELDYFVKNKLKAKYYIRYVDDFVILHRNKKVLQGYRIKIEKYLKYLKLELHPDKTKIKPLRNGTTFLGYRIFYHYRLLRKSNIRKFEGNFKTKLDMYEEGLITYGHLIESLQGWFGYALWANTYKYRNKILKKIKVIKNRN